MSEIKVVVRDFFYVYDYKIVVRRSYPDAESIHDNEYLCCQVIINGKVMATFFSEEDYGDPEDHHAPAFIKGWCAGKGLGDMEYIHELVVDPNAPRFDEDEYQMRVNG